MNDDINQENSSLTAKEKKTQIIERITAAIITIMRTTNLIDTSVIAALTVTDVNNRFSKQFKSENIEFFNSELDIENDSIIFDDKL